MKELRVRAGLRQVDVANWLDVDQATVCYWESGTHKPFRKYIEPLARLYSCSISDIQNALEVANHGE